MDLGTILILLGIALGISQAFRTPAQPPAAAAPPLTNIYGGQFITPSMIAPTKTQALDYLNRVTGPMSMEDVQAFASAGIPGIYAGISWESAKPIALQYIDQIVAYKLSHIR